MDPFAWMDHPLAIPLTLLVTCVVMYLRLRYLKRRLEQKRRALEAKLRRAIQFAELGLVPLDACPEESLPN